MAYHKTSIKIEEDRFVALQHVLVDRRMSFHDWLREKIDADVRLQKIRSGETETQYTPITDEVAENAR